MPAVCNTTHHTGCLCHEERRDNELLELQARNGALVQVITESVHELRNAAMFPLSVLKREANGRAVSPADIDSAVECMARVFNQAQKLNDLLNQTGQVVPSEATCGRNGEQHCDDVVV